MLQTAQYSFQSALRSTQMFWMISERPSSMPTMLLNDFHQFSKSSSRASSGTRSSSSRRVLTFSFQRLRATTKSRSLVNWTMRGCELSKGARCCATLWRCSEGWRAKVSSRKTDAFEKPRRTDLYRKGQAFFCLRDDECTL